MSHLIRTLALATVIVLGAGACGDESADEGGEPAAPQTEESPAEATGDEGFCSSIVEAETAVLAASSGGDPGDLESLLATAEETTPKRSQTKSRR
jgi:hypothetical protein